MIAATTYSELVSLEGLRKKTKNTFHLVAIKLQPFLIVNSEETQDVKTGNWPQIDDFSKPKVLYLPIHRKVLNSLTWDIWFSFINSNLLFLLAVLCCKTPLYHDSSLESSEQSSQYYLRWCLLALKSSVCLPNKTQLSTSRLWIYFSWQCYSHAFQETNSLRRTMQIVECSLLHQRAQGRVSSLPRTPTSICENLLYPMCTCPNPPAQIPWGLQRKGNYNHNNPIIHMLCVQTVNNQ